LNRWEQHTLAAMSSEPAKLLHAIAATVGAVTDALDRIGDGWLVWRVERLASSSLRHPLCNFAEIDPERIMRSLVSLTDAGLDVLGGSANAIELNGVDDWIGGVHLSTDDGTVWVRTEVSSLVPWEAAEQGTRARGT
jgi:hypothetical protein